jgi:hypothetical protein
MCELAERDMLDDADQSTLATIEEIDNPFAYLNYRVLTAETA